MDKLIYKNRISALRQLLKQNNITAIVVPTADPHLSEYLPKHWQAREWLTGFTGSVGTLVVTQDFAGLWTDSRYWVQAQAQLAGTGIDMQKLERGEPNYTDWLAEHLVSGDSIAIDGNVMSVSDQKRLLEAFLAKFETTADLEKKQGIYLITDKDFIDRLWEDRPRLPSAKIYAHDVKFVSQSTADKLAKIRQHMLQLNVTHHLLSSLDDIAWITNLRGNDVEYNPVFLAHMLISHDVAILYIDRVKVSSEIEAQLNKSGIKLADYTQIQTDLAQLDTNHALLLDPSKVAVATINKLDGDVAISQNTAPSTFLKSIKSQQDIEHIRDAMRQDGVALCEFFNEFETRLSNGERLSELDVDSMLIDARSRQPHYVSPSFPTIAGYNENGALPHYRALESQFSYLDVNNEDGENTGGLLLIDSGGQYQNGTTDITRVVGIGQVSDAQRHDFTVVLKAHIALAVASFPEGISAPLLDSICRAPLWKQQLDYGHGTGHGVGYFLNVHEGPQGISYSAPATEERAMRAGMITSNEPGLYREGKWGIRIENLVANLPITTPTETEFGDYLYFETLTLCPIDTRLIEVSLLNDEEIEWLNHYHQHVYNELSKKVTGDTLMWLKERTKPV